MKISTLPHGITNIQFYIAHFQYLGECYGPCSLGTRKLESEEEEQPAEQTGVETGVVAPSTPTTRSVVGNNVETKDDGAAATTNREEFESEGENKQRKGGGREEEKREYGQSRE